MFSLSVAFGLCGFGIFCLVLLEFHPTTNQCPRSILARLPLLVCILLVSYPVALIVEIVRALEDPVTINSPALSYRTTHTSRVRKLSQL